MGSGDDPEAFLVTFERVATATRWPLEHWVTLLAPYLTGPAQKAYRNLDPQSALDYAQVKEAILDQTGVSPETFRQRLRHAHYPQGAWLRAVAQQIRDNCERWLEPGKHTSAQVAECIALVQLWDRGYGQPLSRRGSPTPLRRSWGGCPEGVGKRRRLRSGTTGGPDFE
uniref:SCAN box domain-containing protein n=1 Tax=Pelusios castaneus TaxID=367368 RepID=A0A8C8VE63_9SAUR